MEATRTWHIQHDFFLIADVKKFVSGKMITFSQGGAAKIKSKQFQSLAPGLKRNNAQCKEMLHELLRSQ